MLNSAVDSIVQELNQFIGIKFQTDEEVVILSNLMNLDGTVAATEKNKIIVSVINIQEDKIAHNNSGKAKGWHISSNLFKCLLIDVCKFR